MVKENGTIIYSKSPISDLGSKHLIAALEFVRKRDWYSAVQFFKEHYEVYSFDDDLHFALYTKALRTTRNFEAADAIARKGLTLFANSRTILNEFSWNAEKQKNWSLAVERLLKLLAASNGKAKPQVYQRLLKAMRASKQLEDASAICQEALFKYPDSSIIRTEVAYTQRVLGGLESAITHLIYVVENLPDDASPSLYKNLIVWLRNVGHFERSDFYAQKAIAMFGELALYHEYLLNAEKQKHWIEVISRIDKLPELVYEQDKAQFDRRRLSAYRKMKMEYTGKGLNFVTKQVLAILSKLREANVPHCLMRNFLFKQDGSIGSDIDLAVDYTYEKTIDHIMFGFGFIKRKTATDWYYFVYADNLNIWLFIDLHDGAAFMTAEAFRVMANNAVISSDGLPVPQSGHYWGLLVLRELFKPGSLKPRHLEQLEYLLTNSNISFFSDQAKSLFSAIPTNGSQQSLLDACIQSYLEDPENFWGSLNEMRWNKLPPQDADHNSKLPLLRVCLVGIDGAGKTTAIENLKSIVPNKFPLVVMPMKAKTPISWFGKNRNRKYNLLGYNFQLRYLGAFFDFADKIIRYRKSSKEAADKQGVVLFERWTADTTIAHHFKENQKTSLSFYLRYLYLLEKFMPKPDLFIYLDLTKEEALQRKSEDAPDVIEFRHKHYRDFYSKQKNTVFLDASVSQDEICYKIEAEIFKALQQNQGVHNVKA